MKTFTLTITGTQKYWFHPELIRFAEKQTGWDENKVRQFLSEKQALVFNQQTKEQARAILDELEKAGFQVELIEIQGVLRAAIQLPDEKTLAEIKEQLREIRAEPLLAIQEQLRAISEQVELLSARQSGKAFKGRLEENPVYQKLMAPDPEKVEPEIKKTDTGVFAKLKIVAPVFATPSFSETKKGTTESDIGKYWLSRIGIFTLLLGVVFLVTYTSQFLGAWGKLAIGALLGCALAGTGNFLSRKESYHKWAMSAIGGGWAVLYFTVFAAYHVPMVRVIQSPFLGFFFMLVVAAGFIIQSLQYRSRALAFMAYFLAYFATVSTDVSFYTLVASYLLAVSAIYVTRKLGWNWLALFCLLALYGIHWVWVEPSIYKAQAYFAGENRVWEILVAPWVGGSFQAYPAIDQMRSCLHLSFLALYWTLFTVMGVFQGKEEKDEPVMTSIALLNGLVFVVCVMHHLHVYYPATKWMFALVMGTVYLGLSMMEEKRKQQVLSDIYLVFSTALFCLIVPMYFKGSSISYAWAAASASLIWLGLHHKRTLLRVIGWILATVVVMRGLLFDSMDRTVIGTWILPINPFFFVCAFVSAAFFLIGYFYDKTDAVKEDEKTAGYNAGYILAACYSGAAFLMGGPAAIGSSVLVLIAAILMVAGILKNRFALRCTGIIFTIVATLRFVFEDGTIGLSKFFSDSVVCLRYSGALASIAGLFVLGEWIRRRYKSSNIDESYFRYFSITAAALFLILTWDPVTRSILSLVWGTAAFGYIIYGFNQKERVYRWMGLSVFLLVIIRLFAYDFAQLQVLYRIISFIGLGLVFVVASFLYNYYSKIFLSEEEKTQ